MSFVLLVCVVIGNSCLVSTTTHYSESHEKAVLAQACSLLQLLFGMYSIEM